MKKIIAIYIKPYFGQMSIGFLIKFIGSIVDLFIPYILAHIIDSVIPTKEKKLILLWGLAMIFCAVIAVSFNIIANRKSAWVSSRVTEKLRHDLFEKIMNLSSRQMDEFTKPSLISRMTSDTYEVQQAVARLQRVGIRAPILLIGGIMITFTLDYAMALVLLAVIPILLFMTVWVSKKGIPVYRSVQEAADQMVRVVREDLAGIRVIKALSKTEYEKEKFQTVNGTVIEREKKASMIMAVMGPVMNILLNLGLVGVILVGAYRVNAGTSQVGGMAQEEGKVGSYREFAMKILPRIKKAGYNTVQLMAIMEHPYYGSFGYQVSNFFAASSWFGRPEDLKFLVNKAHKLGIRVLLDVVHSHAVKNTAEGINMFDGTTWQFFHDGPKGDHPAWGTKCFDYGKTEVIHFLLSNLKFWMTEYHFDGFRFDGVTSMLYHDHGLGTSFDSNDKYFSMNTHVEAVTYLQLANELIRQVNPNALTIAEDMSGMPGMCLPIEDGGIGFDYRLAMGLPDMWVRTIKEKRDEDWYLGQMWGDMCLRRPGENSVAYVESHDQALVGDKTMIFRLADANMYTDMNKDCHNPVIDRAIALHKMIRLFTLAGGGEAYLNFMGNEFGHPEWIDFPREGNGWSFHYCRRQWSLYDNENLKYQWLGDFDRDMVRLTKRNNIFQQRMASLLLLKEPEKVIVFYRKGLLFAFNFNTSQSFTNILVPIPSNADYTMKLSSDDAQYGGQNLVEYMTYEAKEFDGKYYVELYLPARTAVVLKEGRIRKAKKAAEPKKEE